MNLRSFLLTTPTQMTLPTERQLTLRYSGRIIDHLGLQMYQSPVAAVAELVANAWDADAENVDIELPSSIDETSEIVVRDDGNGMTFDECQHRFLNVGYARRGQNAAEFSTIKNRRILGRKGIGKFAGFGIAKIVQIETNYRNTGESTIFEMDISKLRSEEYVEAEGTEIDLIDYQPGDADRLNDHGTIVRLSELQLSRARNPESFARSMARRFLLHEAVVDFSVRVNGVSIADFHEVLPVEFEFPKDYRADELPPGITIDDGWGIETLGDNEIKWRVLFYEDTIDDEEMRGISVFAGGKMVQSPFFFNLSGGLSGQHGQQYVSGRLQADCLDEQIDDLVAPERQRVNWDHPLASEIESWGQQRIRRLLSIWRDRRGETRQRLLDQRVANFSNRLNRLSAREQRIVSRAIRQVATVESLSQAQFEDLGSAIIAAWEQGRLHDLIEDISNTEDLSSDDLLGLLAEAQVLTALNTAEAIKTKILTVAGLKQRIEDRELENDIRDYISANPWLVSPRWENFARERTVNTVLSLAASQSGIDSDEDFRGRIDLALSSGEQLLILEFMRPGLKVDWDHVSRFEQYVTIIDNNVTTNTASRFNSVTGYLVADRLDSNSALATKILTMAQQRMYAMDWPTLFANAISQWDEILVILAGRDPDDERLSSLLTD